MVKHYGDSENNERKIIDKKGKLNWPKDMMDRIPVKNIITIGSSTGGPKALQEVIPLLPADIPAAVFIVQHMPAGFTRSLAERLDRMSSLKVKEAEDGEIIKTSQVYIAPGDYHMMLEKQQDGNISIKLSQEPPVGGHRPSVDVTLKSLSRTGLNNIMVVIMTGMGRDGSEGIKLIKNINKGYIIAQDEKSSIVYGMPKAAVQTGVVDVVVQLKDIAGEIIKYLGVYDK